MIDRTIAKDRIHEALAAWDRTPAADRAREALRNWDRDEFVRRTAEPLLCAGLFGAGIAAGARNALVALPAAGAVAAGWTLRARTRAQEPQQHEHAVNRARQHAELGRKLAIYERETGLLAYWFAALRCDEECTRSARYGEPLTIIVVECAPENQDQVRDAAHAMTAALRAVDILSYVGNGRFIAILPNTPITMLTAPTRRLHLAGFDRMGAALTQLKRDRERRK